jgi:hypothetical protein
MRSEEISFQELWGKGYNLDQDEVRIFTYSHETNSVSFSISEGLAYALLCPPHGLISNNPHKSYSEEYAKFERQWMVGLIHKFCTEILELNHIEDGNKLQIQKWPTNWSNYFDAGDEWWGSFCWTITNLEKQWITVITASTTD